MQSAVPIEGSPFTKPCPNSEMTGTANESSASGTINSTDGAGTAIHAGPVPLYLIPRTLSAEIHAHGGDISGITIQRCRSHFYAITLTKLSPQANASGNDTGGANAD